MTPVQTVHFGTNADLIAEVCRLYAQPDMLVADVTYSTGRFWRKTNPGRFRFLASDLIAVPGVIAADFRALPYHTDSIDIVVFDPPYSHNSSGATGQGQNGEYAAASTRYDGHVTTGGMYHADIMELYRDGMAEAYRVLKPDGGQLWVKCKDETQREIQCWSHIEVYEMAMKIGFCARDLFLLVPPTGQPAGRWAGREQRHAYKAHSFLWVFTRPDERYRKLLARTPPYGGVKRKRDHV
jgi:DNA methylase